MKDIQLNVMRSIMLSSVAKVVFRSSIMTNSSVKWFTAVIQSWKEKETTVYGKVSTVNRETS